MDRGHGMARTPAIDHDPIAAAALATYLEKLPPRGAKPDTKSNARLEWTVLAAFVLSYPHPSSHQRVYTVISLATGLKCQPYTSLSPNGDILHDQHAEVLARRGARLWLLNRLQQQVKGKQKEDNTTLFEQVEQIDGKRRCKLAQSVRLHLYVSTLPCGDASNKLLEFQRAAQDVVSGKQGAVSPEELLDIHSTAGKVNATIHSGESLGVVRGRASSLHPSSNSQRGAGSLRTKPGRPDAPPSICMSCSDKIALWNTSGIGIQGSLLSAILEPVYISSLTLSDHPVRHIFPPFPLTATTDEETSRAEHSREILKRLLADDCRRSLSRGGRDIEVAFTSHSEQFSDGKESRVEVAWSQFPSRGGGDASLPEKIEMFKAGYEPESCPNSVLFIADNQKGKVENLASGTKMGAPTKRPKPTAGEDGGVVKEPLKPTARSLVCRLNFFQAFLSAYNALVLEKEGEGAGTCGTAMRNKAHSERERESTGGGRTSCWVRKRRHRGGWNNS